MGLRSLGCNFLSNLPRELQNTRVIFMVPQGPLVLLYLNHFIALGHHITFINDLTRFINQLEAVGGQRGKCKPERIDRVEPWSVKPHLAHTPLLSLAI